MERYDVLVLGSGYSGCAAAIAAKESGRSVAVLEKAPHTGGISICSAGGVRVAKDEDDAFAYLKATNGGKTPDDVQRVLARGMCSLEAAVKDLGKGTGASINYHYAPGNYPLPGFKTFGFVTVDEVPGLDLEREFPYVKGNKPQGARLYYLLQKRVRELDIPVLTNSGAAALVRENGRVCGVRTADGREFRGARKVILACGGFEAAPEVQDQFWPGGMAYSAAFKYNTGDGLRLAMGAGADIWHMWHFHGCYGFAPPRPDYPYGVHIKRLPDWIPGEDCSHLPKMSWILLDQRGKRFTNEYQPYTHDTGARDLAVFDPATQTYPRNPCWMVTDAAGLAMYPLGKPLYNDESVSMDWSADNRAEVANGWIREAATQADLADAAGLPEAAVRTSIARWNEFCRRQNDEDFSRPSMTMHPLLEPPYYTAPMVRVVTNTQGGPRRDTRQRVLTPERTPVPGLYAVGECGSTFGHLYLIGGNLAECFISGGIAGRDDEDRP